jgi:dihydroorotate dehydrogenase
MYRLVKSVLFSLDPEKAHHFTLAFLSALGPSVISLFYRKPKARNSIEVMGLRFENQVGLAAGLDKNAVAYEELGALGFGFVEVGTVTPRAQPGNPKPRLFRLTKNKALINRMGFNNYGAMAMLERLKKRRKKGLIVGANIGKNKDTPSEKAAEDYLQSFDLLFDVVDYFVVNVSSPNTPGLRDLQEKEPLTTLLNSLQSINNQKVNKKPILLKIAPDLGESQLDDIIEIVKKTGISGVIATNTTVGREGLSYSAGEIADIGAGGLSGAPLSQRSLEVVRYICSRSAKKFTVIASGGVMSAKDAQKLVEAGADLVQLYTGFIYEGPALIKEITNALNESRP